MSILLGDDGTLDTVVYCSECRHEYRGNYDPGPDNNGSEDDYDGFVNSFIEEIEAEHVCGEDDV